MAFPWDSRADGGALLNSCPTWASQVLLWALAERGTACCSYKSHVYLLLPYCGNDATTNPCGMPWHFWRLGENLGCFLRVQAMATLQTGSAGQAESRAGSVASGVQELVQIPWGARGWLSQLLCTCVPTVSLLLLCFDLATLKTTGVFLLMCSSFYSACSINLLWPFFDC